MNLRKEESKMMSNSEAISQVLNYLLYSEMEGKEDSTDSWYSTYKLLQELKEKVEDEEVTKEWVQQEIDASKEILNSVQQEIAGARKYAPVDKPDSVIIDCAILSAWIERDVPSPDTEDLMHRNRSAIRQVVINKIENGWAELYPKWFKDPTKHLSYFERTLASRLSALVKANLLISDSTGVYKLSPILAGTGIDYLDKDTDRYWSIITGINAIKPNATMKFLKTRSGIKNLLDSEYMARRR